MSTEPVTISKQPAWQDVLGDAEQLIRTKPTFFILRGTVLENDVPVWIADFALRLVQRERARVRGLIALDRCDGGTEYAAGANAARDKYLAIIDAGQAVPPQPDDQAAFETWLTEKCPSGDVSSVQCQWEASSEYKDFVTQTVPPLNN